MKDLLILTTDKNQQFVLQGLLQRPQALGIRNVTCDIKVHPQRDPGVYRTSDQFLRLLSGTARKALVLLDYEGSGVESKMSKAAMEADIYSRILQSGWEDGMVNVIAIVPELEQWIWSDSPEVERVLGWKKPERVISYLRSKGFEISPEGKPARPKEAVELILRLTGVPRSSSLYLELAGAVSFKRCSDEAFLKLKAQLQAWFGAGVS